MILIESPSLISIFTGNSRLQDSQGFTYHVQRKRKKTTYRLCSARINENACKASTIEKDGTFNGGKNTHNHTVEGECNSKDSEVDYAPGSAHEVNCT